MIRLTKQFTIWGRPVCFLVALLGASLCNAQTGGPESIVLPGCGGLYGCAEKPNTYEIEMCYVACAKQADALMNRVYRNGMKAIDPASAEKLRHSQRAWLVDRDNFLAFLELKNQGPGTIGGVVYGQQRAAFIRTRLWILVEGFRRLSDSQYGVPDWMLQD